MVLIAEMAMKKESAGNFIFGLAFVHFSGGTSDSRNRIFATALFAETAAAVGIIPKKSHKNARIGWKNRWRLVILARTFCEEQSR